MSSKFRKVGRSLNTYMPSAIYIFEYVYRNDVSTLNPANG